MSRIVVFTSLLFAVSSLIVACGDDDDDNPGQNQSAPKCKAPYTAVTQTELTAATTAGACKDDTETVCENEMILRSSNCGISCLAVDPEPQAHTDCTRTCLKDAVSPTPGDACVDCYVASVQCVAANCRDVCLAGATTEACQQCRVEKGCTEAFYTCSGLPEPTSTGGI